MWICPVCKSKNQGEKCSVCGNVMKKDRDTNVFDKYFVRTVIGILTCILIATVAFFSVKIRVAYLNKPEEEVKPQKTEEVYKKVENKKADTKTDYQKYAKYFGVEKENVLKYFATVEEEGAWVGANWYNVGEDRFVAFSFFEEYCCAVMVPVTHIYPEINFDKGYITKEELEDYTGVKATYSEFFEEYANPFLDYEHKGYDVMVFCDSNGNVKPSDLCIYQISKN